MRTASTNDRLHAEVTALQNDLARVRKDLTNMGGTLLDQGRKTFRTASHDVQEKVETSFHTVQGYIKDRPVTSALLALGTGLIIGALWNRK